ncbi:MAG: TIGR02186 family protein, partial [Parvularculaceae bacterium]
MMGLVAAIFLAISAAAPARASDVAIALTDDVIDVDAGFSGARVVIFGAVTPSAGRRAVAEPFGDLVAVVRGPESNFRIRPMVREQAIWIAGPGIKISGAPGILLTMSTRPLEEAATLELRRSLQLDAGAVGPLDA